MLLEFLCHDTPRIGAPNRKVDLAPSQYSYHHPRSADPMPGLVLPPSRVSPELIPHELKLRGVGRCGGHQTSSFLPCLSTPMSGRSCVNFFQLVSLTSPKHTQFRQPQRFSPLQSALLRCPGFRQSP